METIFGIKITHLIAGIAGGTVRALLTGGTWGMAVASVLVGAMTAGYLTQSSYFALIRYFPAWADPSTEHALGFVIGVSAMVLCEGILIHAKKWSRNPKLPGG